eukprot:TRINITY_DN1087_c0_g6_i2.p1 TRINITY_DN1087_c0_g6~~TRINITY_DN1087_c0_g6_i2.p1  ORF type:complete len:188 (-),score=21.72 TRINITY_DN1087_c0_g6_i2:342-905(-)
MADDLSLSHSLLTDFCPRLRSAADVAQYRLSDEQIEEYNRNGFVAGIKVLDDSHVDRLLTELQRLVEVTPERQHLWHEFHSNECPDPSLVLFHSLGAWRIEPSFHDLIYHPALTVPTAQLLGAAPRLWHDQLFCKPAKYGGNVAWHQDYSYWIRTQPMAHMTVHVALDDQTVENGCLHYIPGSHKVP